MHVLEYHAIMVRVSMKVHHTDVNVNEVMKVQHVIDKSIYAQILFVIMKVYVIYKNIINQCVNVHLVIEERIVMKKMVCDKNHQARSFSHETKKSILCMLIFLFRLYYLSIDACHNINCIYEQCLINQHDGTPYC